MTRVKGGMVSRRKHNRILKLAKGYWMSRSTIFSKAQEAVLHAGQYAFAGRKLKKRDFRSLWIVRMSAALKENGVKYNKFINLLKVKKIKVDRKIWAQIALEHPEVFDNAVKKVQQ